MALLKRSEPCTLPVRVLQFGEGNFMRAFADWMIHEMNKRGKFNSSVQLVQPRAGGISRRINAQDGLYTLILRGVENGTVKEKCEVITSVRGCLDPYTQWTETVKAACGEELRFIFSNTTEAGIEYREEAYTPGRVQQTYPAKLTSLLFERWKAFGGARDKGVILIPCELIDKNGATLKQYILQYAADWSLPEEFSGWIGNACLFVNTLVDRIVAGYPAAEAEKICGELGYEDQLLDCGELFHFFVIEGPQSLAAELPLADAGLNVVITDNLTPYRTRKVRFLNGAHTADVLAASLGGLTFVDEMMNDPDFGKMTRNAVYNEIYPTVDLPEAEKKFFADSVVERFQNPFAQHRLLSISLNSVSKWKVRVLPTLLDYIKVKDALPPVLTFSLAALIRFYLIEMKDEKVAGTVDGREYPVSDDPEVLDFFAAVTAAFRKDGDHRKLTEAVLSRTGFWSMDLNSIPGMTDAVAGYLNLILNKGIRKAVQSIL